MQTPDTPKAATKRRRITPWASIAVIALVLAGGAAALFAHQERQSDLNRRMLEALRRAQYADARALLDQGADANTRPAVPLTDRWQVLSDVWRQIRGTPRPRETSDPPLLLCRPRLERSRRAARLPPPEEHERERTLEALIRHGANVEAESMSGLTLLQSAAVEDDATLLSVLLKHGAHMNVPPGALPPLNLANGESVRMLIEHGADVESLYVPYSGSFYLIGPGPSAIATPLSHAVRDGDLEAVGLLLEHGAALRVCTLIVPATAGSPAIVEYSVAALFEVCACRPELLTLFLKKYGDINKRNETGMSLLEEEIIWPGEIDNWGTMRKEFAVTALLAHGACPTIPDTHGGTALSETARRANPWDKSPDAQATALIYRRLLKMLQKRP